MRLNRRDLNLLAEAYDDMSGPRGMEDNTSEDAEGFASPVKIDINDTEDLEVDGVDPRDYPDFSDAYFTNGYLKGREEPLSEDELEYLTNNYGEELNRAAHDSMRMRQARFSLDNN